MKKKVRILFFSASRSEFGIIKELIRNFRLEKRFDVQFIVSGTHLSNFYGNSIEEIRDEKIKINKKFKINISNANFKGIKKYSEKLLKMSFDYFEKNNIDYLFIVGDRIDMFPIAMAARLKNIKICHLHGGELTSELIDDYLRHIYTKISDFHFTANKFYRKRVIQMGENPNRVYDVGSVSIDEIKKMNFKKKKDLENILKIKLNNQIILITYQPLSLNLNKTQKEINILMKALKKFNKKTIIFTFPNYDRGNQIIIQSIKKHKQNFDYLYMYQSLGKKNYLSLAKIANVVVGNSSSGIIEVPYLGTKVINIGPRQKGRIKDKIIKSIDSKEYLINKNIQNALKTNKKFNNHNIYGNGNSIKKIIKIFKNKILFFKNNKEFFDINFKI